MKRYLVKRTMIARDTNRNRPGHVETSLNGVGGAILFYEGSGTRFDCDHMTDEMIERYGFKRLCDAKRSWAYKSPEVEEYWITQMDVLTYEVTDGGFIELGEVN